MWWLRGVLFRTCDIRLESEGIQYVWRVGPKETKWQRPKPTRRRATSQIEFRADYFQRRFRPFQLQSLRRGCQTTMKAISMDETVLGAPSWSLSYRRAERFGTFADEESQQPNAHSKFPLNFRTPETLRPDRPGGET